MSWITALAVAILLSMIGILMYLALPKFKKIQKLIDRLKLLSIIYNNKMSKYKMIDRKKKVFMGEYKEKEMGGCYYEYETAF